MSFLELKHHSSTFLLLLTDSRQSQLHVGTKIKSLVACDDKLRPNLASESCKTSFS